MDEPETHRLNNTHATEYQEAGYGDEQAVERRAGGHNGKQADDLGSPVSTLPEQTALIPAYGL